MNEKCLVLTCPNRTNEGRFEGQLCVPCASALKGEWSPSAADYITESIALAWTPEPTGVSPIYPEAANA